MKKGYNNSLLKMVRIFIVFFSWIVIATTCSTAIDLFRSTFIFLLGLLYDYLCLYDNSKDFFIQKVVSILAISCILLIGAVDLLGLFGIIVPVNSTSRLLHINQTSNILTNVYLDMSIICWILLIFPFIACLEFVPIFVRKRNNEKSTKKNNRSEVASTRV